MKRKTELKRQLVILLLFCFLAGQAREAGYFVRGIVRDSITDEPMSFASVMASGASRGTVTDSRGIFGINVPADTKSLQVTNVGYGKKIVPLRRNSINMYVVYLSPSTTELHEVVVHKQKYSKKNNPAVDFANRIKSRSSLTDPMRNDYYSYRKYERFTVALNDFSIDKGDKGLLGRIPDLQQHIDTSEVSGKPILNVAIKEKSSQIFNRREPRTTKEVVNGVRSEGIDEIADQSSMQVFFQDVMREIDLYGNDINLLQNRFVSPLSRIAPDFYKFYLTDTVQVGDERCIVLSFYPHNKSAFGFIGHIYVPENDTTMFIKKVEMRVPKDINLNFIENLYISQTFSRAADGSRLKTSDDLTMEIRIAPGTQGLYARRNTVYSDHSFEPPAESADIFSILGQEMKQPGADTRDDSFWESARLRDLQQSEANVGDLMTKLRGIPLFYWGEKLLKIMFTGYIQTGKKSKFDYGPVNTTVSHNSVEGWRLRAGGMTTANLSRRWFGRGFVAYGTGDHRWKYKAELEYSFADKEYHSREFPVHSLRLTHLYDLDMAGQHYLFTNPDNVFLSFKRMKNNRVTYLRQTSLLYTLELRNNFSVTAQIAHDRQEATEYLPFVDGAGHEFGHYNETSLTVTLRYAPGEKYYQTKSHRIPINLDAPVFVISHTIAPRGWLGNMFAINKTELNISKRFWLSAFGYIDTYIGGGHVWSSSPYLNLLIPNANLSYTIQPQSFALMNPMEFINSSYCSLDLTYWLNGALFNYIPYLKKLKLREVVSFRGIYGHLSHRDDPSRNPALFRFPDGVEARSMDSGPYMEASVGIENIFKCLRIDYVWRLNYRDEPYPIDRSGIRIALHATF